MAITIDWLTRVIYVPKSDLTLIQAAPTEIRELDLNWFRLQLKDLEDSEAGMVNPMTHNHNTAVTLGGLTYARIIEIINDFTVTFEDGAYAVNLVGANSNVGDRVNVNQVSVRSANSAGLVQMREIEYSSFVGGVTIDAVNGAAGVAYPLGTPAHPVNNLADAKFISQLRGFNTLYVKGHFTINSGDVVSSYYIKGDGATFNIANTLLTLASGCVTANTKFTDCWIEGRQNGEVNYEFCVIGNVTNTHCTYNRCKLIGPNKLNNSAWTNNHKTDSKDCFSVDWYVVDYFNSPMNQVYSNHSGKIKFINCTNPNSSVVVQLDAGTVWLDASCTAGHFEIKGIGNYINDSSITNIDTVGLIGSREIEYASFNGVVTIDVVNGVTGTSYPIGTPVQPVNNLNDALIISDYRGFNSLYIKGGLTLENGDDISHFNVRGEDRDSSSITLVSGCITVASNLYDLHITGVCGGRMNIHRCHLDHVHGLCASGGDANIIDTHLMGTIQVRSFADQTFNFVNCVGSVHTDEYTTLDVNGSVATIQFSGFSGVLAIDGIRSSVSNFQMDVDSGNITLNSGCTLGTVTLRGIGVLNDYSTGVTVDTEGLVVLTAVQYSSFNNKVTVDITSSGVGTNYPVGTPSDPVNNIDDALLIAASRGFDTLFFNESCSIGLGKDNQSLAIDNYTIQGKNILKTVINVLPTCSCVDTEFRYCLLTGTLDGGSNVRECLISDLYYVNGYIYESILYSGATIRLGGAFNSNAFLGDCKSGFGDVPTIIDFDNSFVNFTVRGYKGNLKLINCTENVQIALDLDSAHIILDHTITNGNIVITGAGSIEDNTTTFSGTLDVTGMLEPANIAVAFMRTPIGDNTYLNTVGQSFATTVYHNRIYMSVSGTSGTDYGIGTIHNPSTSIADSLILADKFNCNNLHLHSDMVTVSGQDLSYLVIDGHEYTLTVVSGTIINDLVCKSVQVTGDFGTSRGMSFDHCSIIDCTGVTGYVENGTLGGELFLKDNNANWFSAVNCTGDSINPIHIHVGSSNCNVSNWQGYIEIWDQHDINSQVNISIQAGIVTIDSSCTAGQINIFGQGEVYNYSTGSVINTDSITTKDTISSAVLDKSLLGYNTPNTVATSLKLSTFGEAIYINTSTGALGTEYPLGTPFYPCKTITDARTIADNNNIRAFKFSGILVLDQSYTSWSFEGVDAVANNIIVANGQDISFSRFNYVVLTTVMSGYNAQLEDCILNDLNGAAGIMVNCALGGTISLSASYPLQGKAMSALSAPTVINFNNTAAICQLQVDNGVFRFDNMINGSILNFTGAAGLVTIDSSCAGGYALLSGLIEVYDNSAGAVVINNDSVINNITISTLVGEQTANVQRTIESTRINPGYGNVWYYDPINGNDNNDGKTRERSVLTFTKAHELLTDGVGDIIFIVDTSNSEINIDDQWVITKHNFSIRGAGWGTVLYPTTTSGASIDIQSSKVSIENFQIRTSENIGSDQWCVNVHPGGNYCTFRNMKIKRGIDGGILIDSSEGIYIDDCIFEHFSNKECIAVKGNSHEVVVENNFIYDAKTGIAVYGTAAENWIKNNLLHDLQVGVEVKEQTVGHLYIDRDNLFANNVIDVVDLGLSGINYFREQERLITTSGVWDEYLNTHQIAGTAGYSLSNVSLGANPNDIASAVWQDATALSLVNNVNFIKDIEGGRWSIIGNQMVFYKEDNITELARFNLFDANGVPAAESVFDRQRV